jgi:DNA repair protein RadC
MSETLEVRTYDVLSIGGKDMTLVLPHEIFEHIIITKSRAFILIHNHPSGNPTPSFKDREIMQTLKEQSGVMKIKFVDFIIVGEGCYWSMVKEGLEEYVKEAAA